MLMVISASEDTLGKVTSRAVTSTVSTYHGWLRRNA